MVMRPTGPQPQTPIVWSAETLPSTLACHPVHTISERKSAFSSDREDGIFNRQLSARGMRTYSAASKQHNRYNMDLVFVVITNLVPHRSLQEVSSIQRFLQYGDRKLFPVPCLGWFAHMLWSVSSCRIRIHHKQWESHRQHDHPV